MTRVLSELLGAREPLFAQSLRQLERLAGHPQADIRLSTQVQQAMRTKLEELGLDGHDTTGPELYAALGQRLKSDESRFTAAVQQSSAGDQSHKATRVIRVVTEDDDIIADIARVLGEHIAPRSCFALKPTAAKKILRANLPRKTMKALGYRSADSMLKHESVASLFAAAWLVESSVWAKRVVSGYTKLKASDFELRQISIEHPSSKRWQELSESVVASRKHHVLSFKELGSVVLLPLPKRKPPLSALTTAVLTLHAVNEIRAAGTFLKLHQMQPRFGSTVQQVIMGEPMLPAVGLDEPVAWHSLHQFFARAEKTVRSDIFEPLVSAEELAWTSVEQVLSKIEPSMDFWHNTAHLGLLSGGQPVSCNLTDTLLGQCNRLPYERRIVQYFKQALRSEILLRYLSHDHLELTIFGNVQTNLAPELANARM